MTGMNLNLMDDEAKEPFALNPPLAPDAVERNATPILSVHEIDMERAAQHFSISRPKPCECIKGLTMQTLLQMMMTEPQPALREALLSMPVSTRADAMSALDVLALCDDAELAAHLISGMKAYVSII